MTNAALTSMALSNDRRLRPVFAIVLGLLFTAASSRAGQVQLISQADPAANPARPVGAASGGLISADGLWVAFASTAPDLVPGQSDGNNAEDVFLLDRGMGTFTLVSHAAGSTSLTANGTSRQVAISGDGRFVLFASTSSNLLAGQSVQASNFGTDLFLWDRTTGTTVLVSHAAGSSTTGGNDTSIALGMSSDGQYVAFASKATDLISGGTDTNGGFDVFLWDRTSGVTTLVSHTAGSAAVAGNAPSSFDGSLSADGRWLTFSSLATDLVAGTSDANAASDVFLWDRTTGVSILVSHDAGAPATAGDAASSGPVISKDGGWIAFSSLAGDLVSGQTDSVGTPDLFLWERASGTATLVTHMATLPTTTVGGLVGTFSLSDDGSYVAFSDTATSLESGQVDNNAVSDVFLFERATGFNTLVSHSTSGGATAAGGTSLGGVVSGDGSHVEFISTATDVVGGVIDGNGTFDLFLWTRASGETVLVSHAAGAPSSAGNAASNVGDITPDGGLIVFASQASNLVATGDDNSDSDVFLWETATGNNSILSESPAVASATPETGVDLTVHGVSSDGRFALYLSASPAIVPGQIDLNSNLPGGGKDVFLVDRTGGTTALVSHNTEGPTTTGNGASTAAVLSADGRWVAFLSAATDLVAGYSGGAPDIFLWDRQSGAIVLASRVSDVSPTTGRCTDCGDLSISGDGHFLAWRNAANLELFDRDAGTVTLITQRDGSPGTPANGSSALPAVSADGAFVAFVSAATDLANGQSDSNGGTDVFLWNRAAGSTTLVSHTAGAPQQAADDVSVIEQPAISSDGRFVAYESLATDLVSGAADSNGATDVFVYDRTSGTNVLASHTAGNANQAANGASVRPYLSGDGAWVAYTSTATDLVSGVTDTNGARDAFLFDRAGGTNRLLSAKTGTSQTATGDSIAAGLSANGSVAAVLTTATDLLPGITDLNGVSDLYLVNPTAGTVELASRSLASATQTGNGASLAADLDADGQVALFVSNASDLVANDHNIAPDLFALVHDSSLDYYTLTPCRLLDTRQAQDGPALASGTTKTFQPRGVCGIPATARALELNVTVTAPTGDGYLTAYPGGTGMPIASTVNFVAGITRANNAVVPLGSDGTVALTPLVGGAGTVHVVIDVAGYFE